MWVRCCFSQTLESHESVVNKNGGKSAFAVTLGLIFEDGGCVAPAECPCEFHGTLYPTGSVVKEDCNTWSVSTVGERGRGRR